MADVSYTRINWQSYPSKTTQMTAANLNVMDKGIADCAAQINTTNGQISTINGQISSMNTAISGKVNTSDIQNNLSSTATNVPLSANMGRTLAARPIIRTTTLVQASINIVAPTTAFTYNLPSNFVSACDLYLRVAWPTANWNNGAIVSIPRAVFNASTKKVAIEYTTTSAQTYSIIIELTYIASS